MKYLLHSPHRHTLRKIAFIFLLSFISISAFSQFSASGQGKSLSLTGSSVTNIDAVFLFNGITADNQVQFTGSAQDYLWQKYDGTFVGNASAISVEDNTGYILTVNGQDKYYIWVIDYQKYLASLTALTVVEGSDKCSNITLDLSGNIPNLTYKDKNNAQHTLTRQFQLSYADMEYSSQWSDLTRTQTITAPISSIQISAPYKDTSFTLSGDQYASEFGITTSVTSATYSAIRVECHLTGSIIERDATNEADKTISELEGSGPLNVSMKSNANLPVTQFYEWKIYNTANTSNYVRYTDTDLRYVFPETGTYKVMLTVTNSSGSCSYSDSLTVIVSGSFINVPNVFTPNGDGKNDQFKVSYRSISDFKILLYSSWSGRVYTSTDPAQGWDGRIGGKIAPPGVYYYLITATGTDGKKFKLKGNVNLLRSKN